MLTGTSRDLLSWDLREKPEIPVSRRNTIAGRPGAGTNPLFSPAEKRKFREDWILAIRGGGGGGGFFGFFVFFCWGGGGGGGLFIWGGFFSEEKAA